MLTRLLVRSLRQPSAWRWLSSTAAETPASGSAAVNAATSEAAPAEGSTNFEDEFDENFDDFIEDVTTRSRDDTASFAKLLRNSKFTQLGDFDGRLMVGEIVHRVQDDLYIDMGLKFNAVCKAPSEELDRFTLGSRVLVRLRDPELSERFLGSKNDLTLLEADASLIKLLSTKNRRRPNRTGQEDAAKSHEDATSAQQSTASG